MMKLIKILCFLFISTIAFAQNNFVQWDTLSIPASDSLTDELDIRGDNLKIISIAVDTASWTSANLTVYSYNHFTKTWELLEDEDGTTFTITIGAITEPVRIALPPAKMAGLEHVKFKSSATQTSKVYIYVQTRAY